MVDGFEIDEGDVEEVCKRYLRQKHLKKFAKQYGNADAESGHIEMVLRSARWRGCNVPPIPWEFDESPPRNEHGMVWRSGNTPVCYTSEPYGCLDGDTVRRNQEFCDRWGLDLSVHPISIWNPGHCTMIAYTPKTN